MTFDNQLVFYSVVVVAWLHHMIMKKISNHSITKAPSISIIPLETSNDPE